MLFTVVYCIVLSVFA